MTRNMKTLLIALLSIAIITAIFLNKGAFHDSPWDAPIYFSRGKAVAEELYLRDMASHAVKTAANLPRYRAGENTPYWYFMRFGNILIIGGVVAAFGAVTASIQAAFLLYTLFMAASVVMGVLLYLRLSNILDKTLPKQAVLIGGCIAALTYLASDTYRHLSGVFVAEVPALFFATGSMLALVMACERRNIWLAIISGMLGFALYTVKIEGVWAYLSFCIVYVPAHALLAPRKLWWPAVLVSGISALSFYAIYSWWLWPLTDPRLLQIFAKAFQTGIPNPVAPFKIWIAAGGLLWIGLFIGLVSRSPRPILLVGIAWLGLLSIPYIDNLINNHGTTVLRNYAIIMPPLLLASATGWSVLVSKFRERSTPRFTLPLLIALIGGLLALSHAETYAFLKQLPGGWRLQRVKNLVSPAPYERKSYPVQDLADISRQIYAHGERSIIIPGEGVTEEHLTLISFFSPPSMRAPMDEFLKLGERSGTCDIDDPVSKATPVIFCGTPPSPNVMNKFTLSGYQVLYLRDRAAAITPAHSTLDKNVFVSNDLVLYMKPANP